MGLERQNHPVIVHGGYSINGCCQLIRMVGIVIINICPPVGAFILHPPLRSGKSCKATGYCFPGNSQHPGCTGCTDGIKGIVPPQYIQIQVSIKDAITEHIQVPPVGVDILSMYPVLGIQAKAHIVQALQRLQHMGIVSVGKNAAAGQLGKFPEGFLNIRQILEIIQMIRFNIQNHRQGGKEIQEGVAILAALQNDGISLPYPVPCPEQGQIAANHHGGVHVSFHQNMSHHRGGGGLSVGTGYAYGIFICLHDNAPGLGPFENRNASHPGCGNLRIVIMGGSGTDNAVRSPDIFLPVTDIHLDAFGNQLIGGNRGIHIGAGYRQTHSLKYKSQRTHRHTADSNQMHPLSRLEIFF